MPENIQNFKDSRCSNLIFIMLKRDLNIIFADGFVVILSAVVLPVFYNKL